MTFYTPPPPLKIKATTTTTKHKHSDKKTANSDKIQVTGSL